MPLQGTLGHARFYGTARADGRRIQDRPSRAVAGLPPAGRRLERHTAGGRARRRAGRNIILPPARAGAQAAGAGLLWLLATRRRRVAPTRRPSPASRRSTRHAPAMAAQRLPPAWRIERCRRRGGSPTRRPGGTAENTESSATPGAACGARRHVSMLGGESNFWTASERRTSAAGTRAPPTTSSTGVGHSSRAAGLAVLEGGTADAGNPRRPRRLRRPPAPHRLPRL